MNLKEIIRADLFLTKKWHLIKAIFAILFTKKQLQFVYGYEDREAARSLINFLATKHCISWDYRSDIALGGSMRKLMIEREVYIECNEQLKNEIVSLKRDIAIKAITDKF